MFNRIILATVIVMVAYSSLAQADESWQFSGNRSGISLYRKTVPGSPVLAFKGEGVIDAPLSQVAAVVLDHDRSPEWIDSLVTSRVVRVVNPMRFVELNHFRAPPMVSDRDFLAEVELAVDRTAKSFTLNYHSIEEPSVALGKHVRGQIIYSRFVLTSIEGGAKTRLQAELQVDPKGMLPKFLVNFVQKGWPVSTFTGIRKQVAKPNIARPELFADALHQIDGITRSE